MTLTEARDSILLPFKESWIDLLGMPAVFPDVPSDPPDEGAWARVTIKHGKSSQASLSDQSGVRRWRRTGIVIVQIFVPVGDGLVAAYDLSQQVINAYQGKCVNGVWFRNVQAKEIGSDGVYEQMNVTADFEYDQLR